MSELFCGIDVGSTNTKVVLVDDRRGVIARHQRPTPRLGQDMRQQRAGEVDPRILVDTLGLRLNQIHQMTIAAK